MTQAITTLPALRRSPYLPSPSCLLGLLLLRPFCCFLCSGTLGHVGSAHTSTTYHLPSPQSQAQQEGLGRGWALGQWEAPSAFGAGELLSTSHHKVRT